MRFIYFLITLVAFVAPWLSFERIYDIASNETKQREHNKQLTNTLLGKTFFLGNKDNTYTIVGTSIPYSRLKCISGTGDVQYIYTEDMARILKIQSEEKE